MHFETLEELDQAFEDKHYVPEINRQLEPRQYDSSKVCCYCGIHEGERKEWMVKDHLVPRKNAWNLKPGPLVDACGTCNSIKSSFLFRDFSDVVKWLHWRYWSRDAYSKNNDIRFGGKPPTNEEWLEASLIHQTSRQVSKNASKYNRQWIHHADLNLYWGSL